MTKTMIAISCTALAMIGCLTHHDDSHSDTPPIADAGKFVPYSTFHTDDLVVDNTSVFGGPTQWGTVAPSASQQAWFQLQSTSTTTQVWIQEDDTDHVGSGGNNEAINVVLRQDAGFAMGTGGNAVGRNMDIDAVCSKTSGTGTLDCNAILLSAQGGDTNEALLITHGAVTVQSTEGLAITAGPGIFSQTIQVTGTGTFDKASGTALSVPNAAFSLAKNGTIGTNSSNTLALNSSITTDVILSNTANDQIFRMTNGSSGGHNYGYDNGGTSGFFGPTLTLYDNTAGKIDWQIDTSQNFTVPNGSVAGSKIKTGGSSGSVWSRGAGAPGINCAVGDLYSNTSGSTNTTLYVCTATNTWTAK